MNGGFSALISRTAGVSASESTVAPRAAKAGEPALGLRLLALLLRRAMARQQSASLAPGPLTRQTSTAQTSLPTGALRQASTYRIDSRLSSWLPSTRCCTDERLSIYCRVRTAHTKCLVLLHQSTAAIRASCAVRRLGI